MSLLSNERERCSRASFSNRRYEIYETLDSVLNCCVYNKSSSSTGAENYAAAAREEAHRRRCLRGALGRGRRRLSTAAAAATICNLTESEVGNYKFQTSI